MLSNVNGGHFCSSVMLKMSECQLSLGDGIIPPLIIGLPLYDTNSHIWYMDSAPIIVRKAILCLWSICGGQLIIYMLFPEKIGKSST